jgi:4-amino-4-deoxy-L-arabinose transferase-like glycosyltransferase
VNWTSAAVVVILALAAALRLSGVRWGLPYDFLNPDEGTVVPHAFHVAQGHLNPGFFLYPSLFFYLLAGVYGGMALLWHPHDVTSLLSGASFVIHPGAYLLAGRLVSVAFGVLSVYVIYRLGREAFSRRVGLLAAVILAVEPLHVKYSHAAVTDVAATAFALLALLLLLRSAQDRGRRWLIAGAAAAGLAMSTKYNLGLLVVPVTLTAFLAAREAARRAGRVDRAAPWTLARRLATDAYLPLAAAFVLGSPFVVLDVPRFWRDFVRQNRVVERGWLGFEHVGNTYWYSFHHNVLGALGVTLLVLAVAGLVLGAMRRTPLDLLLVPFVVVYFVYVGRWHEQADRYILPIVPPLILLAARVVLELPGLLRAHGRVRAAVAGIVAAAALIAPLGGSLAYLRSLAGRDVRLEAKAWVDRTIRPGVAIASDPYGPPLVSAADVSAYVTAGQRPAWYRLEKIKLPVPGTSNLWSSVSALDRRGVRYVIVSSSLWRRILAAPAQYPSETAFYRELRRDAVLVATFLPDEGQPGPAIEVYRLPGSATPDREHLAARSNSEPS